MEGRPDLERIDVELTANEVAHRRPHHRHEHSGGGSGGAADGPPGPVDAVIRTFDPDRAEPGAASSAGGRVPLAVTGVIVVLALVLGFVIGRSGRGDRVATTASTQVPASTVPAATTTFLAGDEIPRVQPTTTVRPTTTLPAPTSSTIELDPRLAGLDLTLVARSDRAVLEIDLAEGVAVERELPWSGSDPSALVVGDGWLVIGGGDQRSLVLYDDGTSAPMLLGEMWRPLWIPGTDRFWRQDGSSSFVDVDLAGEPTGPTIEVPTGGWVVGVDPRGDLAVVASGNTYSVGPASVELLGSGDLLGLSTDTAVFRTCDERLRCGLEVVDRRTGERRRVELELDPRYTIESTFYSGTSVDAAISPDERWCAVIVRSDDSYQVALVDFTTGELAALPSEDFWNPGVVWSPDGRFAFFVGGLGIRAYEIASGDVLTVTDGTTWTALGKRPDGA